MHENNEVKSIRLDEIIPNRLQPRTEFDNEKLKELANSIKQHGIINPLILRQIGDQYEIVAGERRYRASKLIGLEEVPAIIIKVNDKTSAELAVLENIQRENLSAIEEAKSYRKLIDLEGITQEQLAEKLGKSQGAISNKMRLLNLCDEVQDALAKNKISERHARSLLQLKNIDDQRELLDRIIKDKLNVKMTEAEVKKKIDNPPVNSEKNDMQINNSISSNISDNIYGNDIVSIEDLNKKEIEKEDIIMNEENLNVNPTVVTNPTTEPINNEINTGAPAFGERFFPSLEDQPTNLNMNNVFDNTQPAQEPIAPQVDIPQPVQPMMENLVENVAETPIVEQPAGVTQNIEPATQPNIPMFVTNSSNVPKMDLSTDSFTVAEPNIPSVVENPVKPPFGVPIPTMSQPQGNETSIEPSIPNPLPPVDIPQPVIPTPQETITTPLAPPPVVETSPQVDIPQPVQPMMEMNSSIPEVPQPSQTGDVLAAMNAIKNLALSIQSIGYKATINEENEQDKYRITIELQK